MKFKIDIYQARLGSEEFRVIRPAAPVVGATLADQNPWFMLELDARAAFTLTGLWLLAARSHNALVHVPLRGNAPPDPPCALTKQGELDLVLSHPGRQFAAHRWKDLRARLKSPSVHTVTWNPNDIPSWDEVHELNRQARQRPSTHPGFGQHLHSHTLFLTGGTEIFLRTARYILDIATWRPDPTQPGYHSATLHPADRHFTATSQGIYLIRWN